MHPDITMSVESIPNSTLLPDVDGVWLKTFNVKTSGHV